MGYNPSGCKAFLETLVSIKEDSKDGLESDVYLFNHSFIFLMTMIKCLNKNLSKTFI